MNPPSRLDELRWLCEAQRITLSDGALARLDLLAALVTEKNRQMNLVSTGEVEHLFERHIVDSLTLLPFVKDQPDCLDIGSGGGFPGLPLAIVCPGLPVTLLEATSKKCTFLREAAAQLDLDHVTVLNARAEEAGHDGDLREKFSSVTARAVASLQVLVELTLPFLNIGGTLFAQKGQGVAEEVENAANALGQLGGVVSNIRDVSAKADGRAVIVEITKTAATPDKYPRRSGMPSKRPL